MMIIMAETKTKNALALDIEHHVGTVGCVGASRQLHLKIWREYVSFASPWREQPGATPSLSVVRSLGSGIILSFGNFIAVT